MVSIDIISGFLGAGKTTFANRVLEHYLADGLKPVYVVNEFGETELDADIAKANGFQAVSMKNGCVCCTLKGDVTAVLSDIIQKFNPTNIVFEMSGIFIFDNFLEILSWPPLNTLCKPGRIFTIVDSVNFKRANMAYGSFMYNQIKNSPVIILSKLDISKQPADELICDIRLINPDGHIVSVPYGEWDKEFMESLLGLKHAQTSLLLGSNHGGHLHFSAVTVQPDGITKGQFDEMVSSIKSGEMGEIVRVKGILKIDGVYHMFHYAMEHISCAPCRGLQQPALTFIGPYINRKKIQVFFNK